jgi:hypothetical protein
MKGLDDGENTHQSTHLWLSGIVCFSIFYYYFNFLKIEIKIYLFGFYYWERKKQNQQQYLKFFFLTTIIWFPKSLSFYIFGNRIFFFSKFFLFFWRKKKTPHDYLKPILRNLYYYTDPGTEIQDIIFRMELVTI